MVYIEAEGLEELENKYTHELVQKTIKVIEKYTAIIERDAKKIITNEGYRDTGRLINSIKPQVMVYGTKIVGKINSGTKYARFIHEGAEHEGDKIVSHFVPFSQAPSLLAWAKKHEIIQKIRGSWYFIDKNNQENLIRDISKSGMRVYTRPTKFFEKPFESIKEKFTDEMANLI